MQARLLTLALLTLISCEPFHQWVHGNNGAISSGQYEIHDGDCEHQPEHRESDQCPLCIKGHGDALAMQSPSPAGRELAPSRVTSGEPSSDILRETLVGAQGARAPPVIS